MTDPSRPDRSIADTGRPRRLGRPAATLSADTRKRIIDGAEHLFARYGFDKTTNRQIAERAGLTAGALYHYFQSKEDLFISTFMEKEREILASFEEAAGGHRRILDKLCAVIDRSVHLQRQDQDLAAFISIVPIEVDRHRAEFDLSGIGWPDEGIYHGLLTAFFRDLVTEGVATGEISAPSSLEGVVRMLIATTAGMALFAGVATDPSAHEEAMASFKDALRGGLFREA